MARNTKNPGRGWLRALARIEDHKVIKEVYRLVEVIDGPRSRKLVFERIATGSTFDCTAKNLNRVWEATADGGRLAFHANGPKRGVAFDPEIHGISYTSGIEHASAALLGLVRDQAGDWRRA
jgi:hypothetical protein